MVLADAHTPDCFICQTRMNNILHCTFPVKKSFINDVHLSFSPISISQTINNLCFPNTSGSGRKCGLLECPEIAGTVPVVLSEEGSDTTANQWQSHGLKRLVTLTRVRLKRSLLFEIYQWVALVCDLQSLFHAGRETAEGHLWGVSIEKGERRGLSQISFQDLLRSRRSFSLLWREIS